MEKFNVYVCGDTHGRTDLEKVHLWAQKNTLTKEDILIVLGDWGSVWRYPHDRKYRNNMKHLRQWARKPFTKFIQLGNHENYDLIERLPTVEKFGGKVYALKVKKYESSVVLDTIYIMQRGEVYTINGKKFFSMGGALSQDKAFRTIGLDYWSRELPSFAEENYGIDNLKKHDFKVDYVITHTCPTFVGDKLKLMHPKYHGDINVHAYCDGKCRDPLTNYFEALVEHHNLSFKEWHFGHWHFDKTIEDKYHCHYQNEPKLIMSK